MEPSQYKLIPHPSDDVLLLQYLNHSFGASDLGNQAEQKRGKSDRKHILISNML